MMKTCAVLASVLAVSACTRSVSPMADSGLAPLRPAPTGQVSSSQLPPPPAPPPPVTVATATPPPVDPTAGTTPASPAAPVQTASAGPVTREGLVGAWKVSSGGGNCQIFMALTKWTGGYRAASRGCPGQVADVSAWDVSGSQVVLKDSSGSTVASLNNSGGTRYDGQTTGGAAISLYR
ncbi:protease inhibitor Inh/omp19 family protein [Aureimonas sp. SA4125]|uniref:protease inhibitor Inh/omp19 family protein n=1 Tax=Aureimonas sp. SA4125 TaxID=2826993 RepID=UPI001CC752EB|nr:protease inhibitor Inh/omp19 family protein [Aureimonas sp. SA4125]